MSNAAYDTTLVLRPIANGLGWIVAASPVDLLDWGVVRLRRDRSLTLRRISQLAETYGPSAIVMPVASASSKRRLRRKERLIRAVETLAAGRGIEVKLYTRDQVRLCFERLGAANRYEIATMLAARFDGLASRLPPKRKPWMSEDSRMSLFDAAALAVTYFAERAFDEGFADTVIAA